MTVGRYGSTRYIAPFNRTLERHGARMFDNPDIDLDSLPRADAVDWQALHPRYVRAQQLVNIAIMLFAAAAWVVVYVLRGDLPLWPALAVAVPVAALLIGWPVVAVPRRGYALREHDMVYRHGVFWRKVTAVPFNRLQHVEVNNGPIDRWFGIGTLKLYTAGGSGGDLTIEGLPIDTAETLREHLLREAGSVVERD